MEKVWIKPNGNIIPVEEESHDDEAFNYLMKQGKKTKGLSSEQLLSEYGKLVGDIRAGIYSKYVDELGVGRVGAAYVSISSKVTSSQWRAIVRLEKEGDSFVWDFLGQPIGEGLRSLKRELDKRKMFKG